jgi:hypothetical protein
MKIVQITMQIVFGELKGTDHNPMSLCTILRWQRPENALAI